MASLKDKLDIYFNEKVIDDRLEDIVGERFGRYSKYIIQERALPDARDGLKPVQRRILYGMSKMGLTSDKPHKKSARIVGDVMGKYHPHGDSSIYEAMVRMSQYWKMGIPTIDMHGNNGSIDGDGPAAMRYTEARMSKAGELLLENIDKRTVRFVPNFDDEELEPVVLPAKFPNLLVNGASGISAGYATEIPPHNLREVVEAVIAKIDDPTLTTEDLMKYILGPDFPTGGIVQGKEGLLQAYKTGKGRIIVRAKTEIVEQNKMYKIIINEIPFDVVKGNLVKEIEVIRAEKKVEGILDVRDESDRDGLKIAIDVKKEANPEFILNYLFKKTNLQVSYNFNMVAILNQRPVLMSLPMMLDAYIDHQKEVITNRSNYELYISNKRLHIVEGLLMLIDVTDEVIRIIRASKNKADSKENIKAKFGFSEEQAEAIVTLQLYRLSHQDVNLLLNEKKELENKIKELTEILSSEKKLLAVIKKELKDVMKISNDRLTVIEDEIANIKISEESLVTNEQVMVAVTKDGYIKRSSIRSFNQSTVCGLKENDSLLFKEEVSTLNTLLIFTSLGNYIFLPVYKIDDQKWKDLGIFINNLVAISPNEKIVKVFAIKDFNEDYNVLITTKLGAIKQTKLQEFNVTRYSKSIRAMKLQAGDSVVSVDMAKNYPLIVVFTKKGKALRFKSSDLSFVGTAAGGVKAINSTNHLACAVYTRNNHDVLILTSRGNIKRIKATDLPLSKRYKAGIDVIKEIKTNPHYIMDAATLSYSQYREDVDIMITTENNNFMTKAFNLKYTNTQAGNAVVPDGYKESLRLSVKKIDEVEVFDIEIDEPYEDEFDDDIDSRQLSLFDDVDLE